MESGDKLYAISVVCFFVAVCVIALSAAYVNGKPSTLVTCPRCGHVVEVVVPNSAEGENRSED